MSRPGGVRRSNHPPQPLGLMAASDEKLWTVDASCCGQKGLLWRHLLGGDKFITRAGDTKTGFAENGLKFAGVEEYRGSASPALPPCVGVG